MRIVRAIVIGAVVGAALFFLPFFVLRGFLFILFIGFLIRLVAFGGWRRSSWRGFNPAWTDAIRNMSDEEYEMFKQKFDVGCDRSRWQSRKPSVDIPVD